MAGVKGQRSGGNRSKTLVRHDLEGTLRSDRHKGFSNPEQLDGEPVQPESLTGKAADHWHRVVELKRSQGSLTVNSGLAIYNHCQVWALAERWQATVDALDSLIFYKYTQTMDGDGNVTTHKEPKAEPASDKLRFARTEVDRTLKTLGLTPDSVGRVRMPTGTHAKTISPLEAIQAGATAAIN